MIVLTITVNPLARFLGTGMLFEIEVVAIVISPCIAATQLNVLLAFSFLALRKTSRTLPQVVLLQLASLSPRGD